MENGQNNNQNPSINNDEKKGRGLFYSVIALAVFIIMVVGGTFAYFTATTSSGDAAVRTGSTSLQLKYVSYQEAWMNTDLIPANTEIVEYSFENQSDTTISNYDTLNNALCKDDYGNSICSVYVFQVYNDANSPQNVSISIVTNVNEFSNLYTMGYEITRSTVSELVTAYDDGFRYTITDNVRTEVNSHSTDPRLRWDSNIEQMDGEFSVVDGGSQVLSLGDLTSQTIAQIYSDNKYIPIYINRPGVNKTLLKYQNSENSLVSSIDIPVSSAENMGSDNIDERTSLVASDVEIGGGEVKTFALVLYIKNLNRDQSDEDSGKHFTGSVVVGSGDGSVGVSGSISAALDASAIDNLQSNQSNQSGGEQTGGNSTGGEPSGGEPSGGEPSGGEPTEP